MVGRSLDAMYPREHVEAGEVLLEVKNLYYKDKLKNISFHLKAGEVLGIYGLLGSGRTLLAKTIFGANPLTSGEIFVRGKPVTINTPHQAQMHGIGYVPAERKTESLIQPLSMKKNLLATNRTMDAYMSMRYIKAATV